MTNPTPPTEADLAQARAELEAECDVHNVHGIGNRFWRYALEERAKYNRAEQRAREAEEQSALLGSVCDKFRIALAAAEQRAVALEAQLAALSRECGPSCASELHKANERAAEAERVRDAYDEAAKEIEDALRSALEAVEQRCRELERECDEMASGFIALREMASDWSSELATAKQRCRELRAALEALPAIYNELKGTNIASRLCETLDAAIDTALADKLSI